MKPELLLPSRIFARTQDVLEKAFVCHRLYEADDRAALLKAVAPRVRGIASFGSSVDAALMDALPKLEIVSNFGVGVDSIDLEAARKRKVIVTNTPDVLNDCVADTTLALTLNVMRRFPQAETYLRAGFWGTRGAYPLTASLGGKVMGILGLGRIGEAIAQRAAAFGMSIHYHNRNRKNVPYAYARDPVALARASDVLVVVTPGGAGTRHIVDARVLDALGPEGYLVNISRGSTVDEAALIRYLQEARIAGAGLDVFENEPNIDARFFALENAVVLPHVGSATVETRTAMGNLQIENLRLHFSGKPVRTRVV
ncbi:MAG: 2-hydroxyacid dehydrogenase [Burkholderiales bacterium]|nr:2-hydroxyacid dehydrogenase [Burkholderiales bacterium]